MKFNNFRIFSIIGALGMISNTLANPIEVIYTGSTCDCQKKLNYFIQKPPTTAPCPEQKTVEYGYKMDVPVQSKAKVTYSFDFTVLEPKRRTPPSEQQNLNLYATIDRIITPKNDCQATTPETMPNSCSCSNCAARRYVNPEHEATRFIRNSRHPNSISDVTEPATSQIMAIFVQPLHQTETSSTKSRHKRDITRIFMRPRKNDKRSERIVKQYNKPLTSQVNKKAFYEKTSKSITSRSADTPIQQRIRPFHHQLKNFLNLPRRLRNKRDIKGEYDFIEEERQQMDLTLPEIIQYMPETLDPNFKRGPCQLGQTCINKKLPKISIAMNPSLNMSEDNAALNISSHNPNIEERKSENSIKNLLAKRNVAVYGNAGGCPLVFPTDNPTPRPSYSYEPLNNPINTLNSPYDLDPLSQQYVAAPPKHYAVPRYNNLPLERSFYGNLNSQPINNAQMDQIIAEIVNKHADFIEATSYHGSALVNPLNEQELQTKLLLNNLAGGYFNSRLGVYQRKIPYYQPSNPLLPLVAY